MASINKFINNIVNKLKKEPQKPCKPEIFIPESVQFAVSKALPNTPYGAFWGFSHISECMTYMRALQADKNIILGQLSNGKSVLVEVNPDFLIQTTRMISPDIITDEDITEMRRGMAYGYACFEKFLMQRADKNFNDLVGIYCTNDCYSITYKGINYPTFSVDIRTALQFMNKWGYYFIADGKPVMPSQAMGLGAKLFSNLIMSPTNTGVFMQIASSFTTEQVKQLKQQYGFDKYDNN